MSSPDLDGPVLVPGDDGYDEARTVFPGGVDRRPTAIAQPLNAADVSRIVDFARDTGLELAVKGGGHSSAGHGVSDGGIVLDLSRMRDLDIDLRERTAWAESGMTAGEYTNKVGAMGFATGFGDTGSVGIGGITLGGGMGLLARKHGLTIDDLLAAEVVTADGRLVRVDAATRPELFWAIRGGGGNFGVATRFKFRIHELEEILGGLLVLPATPDLIPEFVSRAECAPDELTTIASVMAAPPLPFIPEAQRGQLVVMAMLAYAGPPEAGERAVAPFRALAEPVADMVRPMRYPDVFPPEPAGFHPLSAMRTMYVDEVDRETGQTIVEYIGASKAAMAAAQIRVLGGAVERVPADATAYAHRERRVMMNVTAVYGSPDQAAQHEAWATSFATALQRGKPGAYVNFLGDVGEARVREAYPGRTWDRLAAIKARYDPGNLFRMNQNIPPALAVAAA